VARDGSVLPEASYTRGGTMYWLIRQLNRKGGGQ
jgi:hypothetical protein